MTYKGITIKAVSGHYEACDYFGNFIISGDTYDEVINDLQDYGELQNPADTDGRILHQQAQIISSMVPEKTIGAADLMSQSIMLHKAEVSGQISLYDLI